MQTCFKCGHIVSGDESYHGLHQACFCLWFNVSEVEDFTDVTLKKDSEQSGFVTPSHSSFFHGKFRKYSAQLGDKSYILKVQQEDYPELPQIEYLSNIIAKKLGLIIPPFYFIRFLNEVNAFVVHNFMANYHPGNLIHIYHFLDAKDEFSLVTVLNIIKTKVGSSEAIHQFIIMCLFDALIGNHDRHGRNIALIETKNGMVLSPFYDNPSYIGIEDQNLLLAQHNPKGKISTSTNLNPTIREYVHEFNALGYINIVTDFLTQVQKTNFEKIIQQPFLSQKRQLAFLNLIQRRHREFENAIKN